jgi:hypothetical protein
MEMEMEMVHTRMTPSCSVGAVPLIDAIGTRSIIDATTLLIAGR